MEKFTLVKSYRENKELRESFDSLAYTTFSIYFEDWYGNGYWTDNYNPYSFLYKGNIVANVSVNIMDMYLDGVHKRFLQLGTVMTGRDFRGMGLCTRLIKEIQKEYEGKVDGIFLFANNNVLDFYPKFGFCKAKEYQYYKNIDAADQNKKTVSSSAETGSSKEMKAKRVSMSRREDWKRLEDAILKSTCNSRFGMKRNVGLLMFYVTKFMKEAVYYIEEQDAYVIAEVYGDRLDLYEIIAPTKVNLDQVISAFGSNVREVVLGFTPLDTSGYGMREVRTEDTTLFVDEKLKDFSEWKMMFPVLSHA